MKPALKKTPAPTMLATTKPTPDPRSKNPVSDSAAYESDSSLATFPRVRVILVGNDANSE